MKQYMSGTTGPMLHEVPTKCSSEGPEKGPCLPTPSSQQAQVHPFSLPGLLQHPPLPPGISQPLTEFLLLCFKKDTAQRPNAMRLKTHHWLTRRHDATVVATDEMDVGPHSVASLTERSLEPSWPNAILTSVGGGGATPAAALPEHILPKEETIRAVEEILANGLSLRPTPRDTPR